MLEFCRTVPDIVFALIFVFAFGLGALPGVLAITLHSIGTLGKLFAEVNENIDMKPVEGVAAAGGGWLSQIRFGVLPQVAVQLRQLHAVALGDQCSRGDGLGFVGAGGIGQDLLIAIRKFYYPDVSAMLLLIVAASCCSISVRNGCAIACWRWSSHEQRPARRVSCARQWPAGAAAQCSDHAVPWPASVLASYVAGLVVLDMSPGAFLDRLWQLGNILVADVPAAPGTWRISGLSGGLGQTLSIAFFGTAAAC